MWDTFSCIIFLIGLVFVATKTRLKKPSLFAASLTFWICYLIFSIAIIGLGIYSKIKEIKFDPNKLKKPLKAPIR